MSPRRGGPPATTSSAPGILDSARSRVLSASCSVARSAIVTRRCLSLRSCAGPSGVNSSVSIPVGYDPDRTARDAEPGQVRLLVGAAGDHGADRAADRGLEPDPLGAGADRDHAVPPLGDAELVERLHHGNLKVAGGRQGREPAGPAQRVHHVGAVLAPPVVQRRAEGADLLNQVGFVRAGVGRADVLNRDAGGELGPLRQRLAVAPRVHGHLMTLTGQARAHLNQPGIVAHGGLVAVTGNRGAVLGYQGDLHRGCLSSLTGSHLRRAVGAGTLKLRARR